MEDPNALNIIHSELKESTTCHETNLKFFSGAFTGRFGLPNELANTYSVQ